MLTQMHLSGKIFSDGSIASLPGAPLAVPAQPQPGDMKLVCQFGSFLAQLFDGESWFDLLNNGCRSLLPDHPLSATRLDKTHDMVIAMNRCAGLAGRLVMRQANAFFVASDCAVCD